MPSRVGLWAWCQLGVRLRVLTVTVSQGVDFRSPRPTGWLRVSAVALSQTVPCRPPRLAVRLCVRAVTRRWTVLWASLQLALHQRALASSRAA